MPWGEIGAVLAVLVVIWIIGKIWFSIVEGALGGIRHLLFCKRQPPAWHPLPKEKVDTKDKEG